MKAGNAWTFKSFIERKIDSPKFFETQALTLERFNLNGPGGISCTWNLIPASEGFQASC
jgi:hypothetical protein